MNQISEVIEPEKKRDADLSIRSENGVLENNFLRSIFGKMNSLLRSRKASQDNKQLSDLLNEVHHVNSDFVWTLLM